MNLWLHLLLIVVATLAEAAEPRVTTINRRHSRQLQWTTRPPNPSGTKPPHPETPSKTTKSPFSLTPTTATPATPTATTSPTLTPINIMNQQTGKLIFIRAPNYTYVPTNHKLAGFYGILEPHVYLVREHSEAYRYILNSMRNDDYSVMYSPLGPEHKYPKNLQNKAANQTKYIVRVVKEPDAQARVNCDWTRFSNKTMVYYVECRRSNGGDNGGKGWLSTLAEYDWTISIESYFNISTLKPRKDELRNRLKNKLSQQQQEEGRHSPLLETGLGALATLNAALIPKNYTSLIPKEIYTVVLITDSGLDPTHYAFSSASSINILNVEGYTDKAAVANSHGTAVTSCAVGRQYSDTISGIAPGGPIVFGDISTVGGGETLIFPPGFFPTFFASQVHIHIASWGDIYNLGEYTELAVMMDEEIMDDQNVVHVVAIGNDGQGVPGSAPGTAKNVLSVGALRTDLVTVTSFTSTGDLADGRSSPIVYAPGALVWTASGRAYPPGAASGNTQYDRRSGTSFGNPIIGGLCALEREHIVTTHGIVPHGAFIQAVMMNRYSKIEGFNSAFSTEWPSSTLDQIIANGVRLPSIRNSWSRCIRLTTDEGTIARARFSLRWFDPAAMAYASKTLINDLDVYTIPYSTSDLKSSQDGVNPLERWTWDFSTSDTVRILVYAYQNQTFLAPVDFSIHVELVTQQGESASSYASVELDPDDSPSCGVCFPGTTVSCGLGLGNRQCLPNGEWSDCSFCEQGYLESGGICTCRPYLYVRNANGFLVSGCPVTQAVTQIPPALKSEGTTNYKNYILFRVFGLLMWGGLLI